MLLQKAKIILFCGFFLSCDKKIKKTQELSHKLKNIYSNMEGVGSFLPEESEKLIDLTNIEAAKNIKEEEKDLAKKTILAVIEEKEVTFSRNKAMEILKISSNIASSFGEEKREFFQVFENQIDRAIEVVVEEKSKEPTL